LSDNNDDVRAALLYITDLTNMIKGKAADSSPAQRKKYPAAL